MIAILLFDDSVLSDNDKTTDCKVECWWFLKKEWWKCNSVARLHKTTDKYHILMYVLWGVVYTGSRFCRIVYLLIELAYLLLNANEHGPVTPKIIITPIKSHTITTRLTISFSLHYPCASSPSNHFNKTFVC